MVRYTGRNIAVMAVMAGARPEYFPVILAIASTRQPAFMGSTTAFGAMLLVNGPIRKEIGLNSGIGAFSPVNSAHEGIVSIVRGWAFLSTSGAASHRSFGEELAIQLAIMPPLNSAATVVMNPLVARTLREK